MNKQKLTVDYNKQFDTSSNKIKVESMKPTAEDLKLVAEAMGIYKEIDEDHKAPRQPLITNKGNVWNPTEDAEQCIKLLEWLKNQKLKIKIFWNWRTKLWNIDAYNITDDLRIEHKDFKTAVFLAVVEYIKNKK